MKGKKSPLLILLFCAIFAFSFMSLLSAHFLKTSDLNVAITDGTTLSSKFAQDEYYGDGIHIGVDEHALNYSTLTGLSPASTLYGTVPTGWQGYNAQIDISNLQESGQWLGNSDCSSAGGYWATHEEVTGDVSDITEQYQTGDTYPANPAHSLEITLDGWSTSTSLLNGELTGSGSAPTSWTTTTGSAAYGSGSSVAPDIYACQTGGDGDNYFMQHSVTGDLWSAVQEEASVMVSQTISLPVDGDWVITQAQLTYNWHVLDTRASDNDYLQINLRIDGIGVDGHPNLYTGNTGPWDSGTQVVDVTFYLQSGTSWVVDFGFTSYIQAPMLVSTETMNGYFEEVLLTITYEQKIDTGTIAWWEQTTDYSYAGRDLQSATLDLGIRATGQIAEGTQSYIWAQVGSGGDWGTRHYISDSGTYQFLNAISTSWVLADTINVLPDLRGFDPKQEIEIRLGVTIGGIPFGLPSDVDIRFDYVRLNTVAYLDPDDANVNLRATDVTNANTAAIIETGQGSGSVSFSDTWSGGINHQFTFLISVEVYTVSFAAYLQMNETRHSVGTSNFTVYDPYAMSDIEWNVYFDPVDLVQLTDYEFTIGIPNDWTPDRVWIPGSAISYEMQTTAGLMTITTPAPEANNTLEFLVGFIQENDGMWRLRFYAPNYAYAIKSQVDTGTWVDGTTFYPTNSTRTNIMLKNDSMFWSQGLGSRTIYRIQDENLNTVEEFVTYISGATTSTEVNIGWTVANGAIGTYKSVVRWNDSATGPYPSKVGFNYTTFEIWQRTSLIYSIDNIYDYYNSYLQPQFLDFKAQWSDSLLGGAVTGGTFYIEYNDTNGVLTNFTNYIEGTGANEGNYSIDLPTIQVWRGDTTVNFILLKYYYDSQIVPYDVAQTIDVSTEVLTPEAKWNATTYYAESLEITDYNITCKFYDEYEQNYIENGTAPWTNVQVTAQYAGGPVEYFSIDSVDPQLWYFTVDTSAFTGFREYNVSMRVLQSSPYQFPFEFQSFIVRIQIVYSQTDLDIARTSITYPPTGTGDGWTQYTNTTDLYEANIYWNETFLLRVFYENITSGSVPITGATVQMIGWPDSGTTLSLSDVGSGYYNIQLVANTSYPVFAYNLYINASKPGCLTKLVYIRLNVITRATYLDRDPSSTYKSIPWNDNYYILFTWNDTVPSPDIPMINGTPDVILTITGYNYYTISDYANGSYGVLIYANDTIAQYELTFEFTRTNYQTQSFVLTLDIQEIHTSYLIDLPLISAIYGDEYNVTVTYFDVDHLTGIDGNIDVEWFVGYYQIISFNNGTWIVSINSTDLGSFYLNISFWESNYATQNFTVPVNVREIITLLTYDPPGSVPITAGGNITIKLYYQDIDHVLWVTGATVELLSVWNGTHSINLVKPINWTFYDNGDGSYDVELSIAALGLGYYNVSLNISKPFYADRQYYDIAFNIRQGFTQLSSPEAPSSLIPKGFYNLTLIYRNQETAQGFVNSSGQVRLTFDFPENATIYPSIVNVILYPNQGDGTDGFYYLELNLTHGSLAAGAHFIIHVDMSAGPDVEAQELNITVIITPTGTIIGYETPDPVVWNTNVSFVVTYTDISGGEVSSNPNIISINWTAGYYTITYAATGKYTIELNTTADPPPESGYFVLNVTASHIGYMTRTVLINVRVRSIDSLVTYTSPPGTPFNELSTFTLRYWDTYNNAAINGTAIAITASYQGTSLGADFSWDYHATLGYYTLTINTSYWNALGDFQVDVNITWSGEPYYQNQTMIAITQTVQARTSDLSYQNLESTPYNETASFTVRYRDLTAAGNPGIDSAVISIYYSGQLWSNGSDFAWTSPGATSGYYNIFINTTKLYDIGDFDFVIWANWSGVPFHDNKSVSISLSVTERTTELTYEIEGTVPFSNVAIINITYSDIDSGVGIANTTYYGGGHVTIDVYYQGQLWTNGSDFAWVTEVSEASSPGLYMISINTSYLSGIGTFQFNITANWGSPPFFQNKSRLINIITRSPNTDLSYDPPSSTPIGDLVNITIYYINLDQAGAGIDNSTNNIIITANLTLYQVYDLNSIQAGRYVVEIDTSDPALNSIGTFTIQISVKCHGLPYYSNKTRLISLTIKKISTSLVVVDYERVVWWNHNLTITLTYNDTDHGSIGIGSPTVQCGWGTWSYAEVGQGGLILQLNTSVALTDYTTWIYVNKTNYFSQNISIPFTVRPIYTNYQTNASFVSNHPWGYNFTAEIQYLDVDNTGLVSGITVSDITVEGDAPWGPSGDFYVYISGGKFYVEFNTSGCVEDVIYTINITLSKTNYQTQLFQIRASVIYPPSAIFIQDITPATTIPWGQELRILVTYNDTESYLGIDNGSGDVNMWLEGGGGEPGWPTSNYTIYANGSGVYTIVIDTIWTGRDEGTYQLRIYANASHFHEAIAISSITVRKTNTDLILTDAPSTIFFGSSDNFTFWFNNTETIGTPREDSLPNAIIQVWYQFPNGTLVEWNSSYVGGQYIVYDLGTGEYTVTVNSSTNLGIGQFLIYFNASLDSSWGIWQAHYDMGTEIYNLRIIDIDTIITVIEQPSGAVAWGDNFTIRIGYNDTVSSIGILGASIDVTGAGTVWTVYYNQTIGNPTYLIEINSSWVAAANLGNSFGITLEATKPNYKTQQVIVYVIIRDILTTLSYDPFSQTPFNNTALTYIYYQDVVHSESITNDSGQVQIILYNVTTGVEIPIEYITSYTGTPGKYLISFDTENFPGVGTYQFNVSIYWKGEPYYQNQSTTIELVVRKISTLISITPITPRPWDNNVTIIIDYTISDFESDENGDPIDYASVVLVNGTGLTSYPIIYTIRYPSQTGTAGRYTIEIDSSNLQEVKSYNIWIFMNYTNCFSANSSITFQVRNLTTSVFIDPIDIAPYGNHVNVSLLYKVVDTDSDKNDDPITGAIINITTANYDTYGGFSTGNYTVYDLGAGQYIIQIWNHSLQTIGSQILDLVIGGVAFHNEISTDITVQIRNLTTAVYIFPITQTAWGDGVNVTVLYQVLDSRSLYMNNDGIIGAAVNITTAGLNVYGVDYIVAEQGNGYYLIMINNNSVLDVRDDYQIDVIATSVLYHDEAGSFSTFEVRNLTTALTVGAIPPQPVGNEVNLTVHYKVQDPGSLSHNGLPITGAQIRVTTSGFIYGVNYWVYEDGNGDYIVEVGNSTILRVTTHTLAFKASGVLNHSEATTSGSFDIRQLITVLEIQPVNPVPWGNHANITMIYKVSDPDSYYWHGYKIPALIATNRTKINITTSNYDIFGAYPTANYTSYNLSTDGYYCVIVYNDSIDVITSYTLELKASGLMLFQNASASITFELRPLYTFLIYTPISAVPWGDNVTLELEWVIKDTTSVFHEDPIENGDLEITSESWVKGTDYTYQDITGGRYLLNISTDVVNVIQLYTITVKLFYPAGNIYYNTTVDVNFQVRQVFTTHTVVINGTYRTESFSGWPWGDMVPITIYYNYSELTHPSWELVPNSNITVTGQAGTPYESGNYITANYENGTFSLIIDGTVADHGVLYTFDILLYTTSGYYTNDSTARLSIWFRKSTAQIFFLDAPDIFIPWGDNISLFFSYNNTEASGTPGIPGAIVNVSVNPVTAEGYYNFGENASMGPGSWYLTMNTTWAPVTPNNQIEITFTISAVSNSTIVAYLYYTLYIQPIDTELKVIWYDASVWLEQVDSFNLSMRLLDRSHYNNTEGDYNPIENNTYWMDGGSWGQYANLRFNITTREGIFANYTWFWGNVSLYPAPANGYYTLQFHLNQTPDYDVIQELLGYTLFIDVYGDHLAVASTQITVDLKIHTHDANVTFSWDYANATKPNANLSRFESYNDSYYYGDYINITLWFWDLDSGAYNPGIEAALVECNWSYIYYRIFNEYQVHDYNETWLGIYTIQIDTNMFEEIVGDYVLQINVTLETYQRAYVTIDPSYYVNFTILPVPVDITLVDPILSAPYTALSRILVNFTNNHTSAGVNARIWDVNITSVPFWSWWATSTGVIGEIEFFIDSNVLGIGWHVATIVFNKTNYEVVEQNYSFEIRYIYTEIEMLDPFDKYLGDFNLTGIYREEYNLKFRYTDDPETQLKLMGLTWGYTPIGYIPLADYNISDWLTVGGDVALLTGEVPNGLYEFYVYMTADNGTYNVVVSVNRTTAGYVAANKTLKFEVWKADTVIGLVDPSIPAFTIWKFGSESIEVYYYYRSQNGSVTEAMTGATLTYTIQDSSRATVASGTLQPTGEAGHYSAEIGTGGLQMQATYFVIINATPASGNYNEASAELTSTIKPFWEHWIFIVSMIAVGVVAGAFAYRKVKWILLPREVKAIEIAKKEIKKGHIVELPFRDIKGREMMFRTMFADAWGTIDIKPPKLVLPEVVLFASEISSVLRTRMTTPEAETLIATLKSMSLEEAGRHLSNMKVPPEATRRLLTIAGLIAKERLEVINFAQVLSDIKGTEISYSQADEIITTLQSMSVFDADKYLEAMVIPQESRKQLLEMVGVKPLAGPKKMKEPKAEKGKEKAVEKEKPKEVGMSVSEIRAELDKLPGLGDEEKQSLIKDMEKLSLKEQKEILRNLRG